MLIASTPLKRVADGPIPEDFEELFSRRLLEIDYAGSDTHPFDGLSHARRAWLCFVVIVAEIAGAFRATRTDEESELMAGIAEWICAAIDDAGLDLDDMCNSVHRLIVTEAGPAKPPN